jgi:uncharacterized protein YqgC (DUF456 family)
MDPSLTLFLEIVLIVLTGLVMLVGLVGAVVPVLPGAWLIWLAALGYGIVQPLFGQPLFDGWIGGVAMVLLTLMAAADLVMEYVITHSVTHTEGVSLKATFASIGLGLVGIFFFPPIGPLVGSMLGLFLVEYFRHERDWRKALQSLRSYAKGCGWAMVAEVGLCLAMIGVWAGWVALAFVAG